MKEESKRKSKSLSNLTGAFVSFYYFLKLAFKSAPYAFSIAFITGIVGSVFPVVTAKVFGNLINSITTLIKDGNADLVWKTLILYIIVSIIPTILNVFNKTSSNIYYLKFNDFLDRYILKIRGSFDIGHIENAEFQDKIQKSFNNGQTGPILTLINNGMTVTNTFLVMAFNSIVILAIDWKIFLLVVVFSIPKLIIEVKYGGMGFYLNGENSREQRVYLTLRAFFANKFAVIESKLFQIQDFFLVKISKLLGDFTEKRVVIEKERLQYRFLSEILSSIGVLGGLYIAIQSVVHGNSSVGTVVFLFSIISSFSANTTSFLINIAQVLERNLYVTDIRELLDTKPLIKERKNPKNISNDLAPEIEFKDVSFKYPGQNNFVLENISFKIKSGQKLGLVGHNGAGKTTIVRLLLRIHDPVKGNIFINGIDLKDLKLEDWWSKLAVLPQDFSSFNFEAKHSISYGDIKKDFDIEKVKTAAKQSTASDFIDTWKESYERMIGIEFGGAELSKGERQKMALARIFYRNAPIFVLDEPTAAVDSSSTSEIFRNIEKISDEQSVLVISHNFATLRRANDIVVLEHGKIVEEGDHDQLMKNKGLYAELYNQQKSEY